MNSITQEMQFRQSLMKYSEKYGVKRAARKYNKSRSYIYFRKARRDGTVESLTEHSKRPHHHPNEHAPVKWYKRRGIKVECVQTDNGPEFTTRFIQGLKDKPTSFQTTAALLGIRHKLIKPYTPRHNGKVERSHREDHNKFYSCHSFYSCDDLYQQLKVHLRHSNNRPMRPLGWLPPVEFVEFLSDYRVQYHWQTYKAAYFEKL